MPSRRYIVSGRVQGVGFRAFVLRQARTLELDGWVRNRPEGTVEVLATGSDNRLATLERVLAQGPAWSQVDRVETFDGEAGEATATGVGFDVRFDR